MNVLEERHAKKIEGLSHETVDTYCSLSTAHISPETNERMSLSSLSVKNHNTRKSLPVFFPKTIGGELYGYIVVLCLDDDEELSSYPEDLVACMRYADELGCGLLILDSDADIVDDLPTYDWG